MPPTRRTAAERQQRTRASTERKPRRKTSGIGGPRGAGQGEVHPAMASKTTDDGAAITLPTGGGALRGVGGTFSPHLHTGTRNFTLPISRPPCRNGFPPHLALACHTGKR